MARTRTRRAPRRARRERARAEIQAVVDETIALFHWLGWVAEQLYGHAGRGAPRRWVLRRLHRYGPQTVPELARARAQRRQSIQPLIDGLVADDLVALVANPAHARSRRATLTARGAELVARMDGIDARVLAAVSAGIPTPQLATTAATLRTIRTHFAIERRWRAVLDDEPG
jgi:DNA-binding MarR family transcriptional regulator